MAKDYTPVAKTTTIKATSRASIKIRDSFFTLEYTEERTVPDYLSEGDIMLERQALWDTVNAEVDNQIEDTIKNYS